jgi:hypothetical protein
VQQDARWVDDAEAPDRRYVLHHDVLGVGTGVQQTLDVPDKGEQERVSSDRRPPSSKRQNPTRLVVR